ncbi:Asparagine synthetase [glutamine-hydrolyzing] 1 [Halioglobus japonicus]|nr:Asparagine synthetase [glutamine-hydrolyzing] 1 [Halioglobus japonicus]
MKNRSDSEYNVEKGLKRHSITGRYCPPGSAIEAADCVDAMQKALLSSFPAITESAASFAVANTASSHHLTHGGVALIGGRPHFRDPKLAELAQTQGIGAALASGYESHSHDVFKRLFGSFFCVIVDTQANRVLIGIDRLGQHAMYYHTSNDALAFGTSATEALACVDSKSPLQNQGVYNYVYFHMVPSPGTVHRGLQKIPGAHYLDYQNGEGRLVNYWCPQFTDVAARNSFEELSRQLHSRLRSSVEKCLPDSGTVGAFLSGGLDSSTVTGMLAEVGDKNAEAYSIGFAAEGYDEMAFARITAKHFGVKLNEYYVTPQDVVEALPRIATSYDEPFGNSSALPAYFCAKMAVENGVDTLLAGDGGDEFFGGNERYLKQEVFEHYSKAPAVLRKGLIEPLVKLMPAGIPLASKAQSYIAQANTPLPDRLQSYNFLHRHAASEIFPDEFLNDVDMAQPLNLLRSIYHRPEPASRLNRMLYLDWQITLADNDLRKVSHTCSLAGVDVAYPMLDDELVEFSCTVPSAWKIKGKNLRHFYKESLKGWLPRETIEKTKQGFGLPFGVWMRTYQPLREMAYDNLLKLKDRGLIRPAFIDKAIEMHQSQHAAYYGELVWILTVFELWMQGHSQDSST